LLVRTASNAYFPQVLAVISIPEQDADLARAVEQVWSFVQYAKTLDDCKQMRQMMPPVKQALAEYADEEVFAEIQLRRGDVKGPSTKSVKQVEWETLSATREEIGEDRPDGYFYARTLPTSEWDRAWMAGVERVVLVQRLREVVAQLGFTRFEPIAPDTEGELEIGVKPAALARETTWLPAIENKGEGLFLSFKKKAVLDWMKRPPVEERGKQLSAGFDAWRSEHEGTQRQFPGLPYIMLHSFSHLLVTSVALECGYPASSIKERIYALADAMQKLVDEGLNIEHLGLMLETLAQDRSRRALPSAWRGILRRWLKPAN